MIPIFKDPVSLARLDTLHPKIKGFAKAVFEEAWRQGIKARCSCAMRTPKEQQELWNKGRVDKGPIVTWAKPYFSFHNYGLAFDFCILDEKGAVDWDGRKDLNKNGKADAMEIIQIAKSFGFEWGGDWKSKKDFPHFQMTFGQKCETLLKNCRAGKMEGGFVKW